jgi:hypothetical protein
VALVSFLTYLPVRIITPAKVCLPFVLVFVGKDQIALALSATVILSALLVLLTMGLLIIGFDTAMFVRNPLAQNRVSDTGSGASYVQAQRKQNPNRKLVYYGVGLVLQYVSLSNSPSNGRFCCYRTLFSAPWGFSTFLRVYWHLWHFISTAQSFYSNTYWVIGVTPIHVPNVRNPGTPM